MDTLPTLTDLLDRVIIERGGGTYEFDAELPNMVKCHYPLERVGKDQRFYCHKVNISSPHFPMHLDWKRTEDPNDNLVMPNEESQLIEAAKIFLAAGGAPKPVKLEESATVTEWADSVVKDLDRVSTPELKDSMGKVFDPEKHAMNEDGNPIYNKNKSFKKLKK